MPVKRTITFGSYENATSVNPIYGKYFRLPFAIEPPIEVHDPNFIESQRQMIDFNSGVETAANVRITHSTETSTIGTVDAQLRDAYEGLRGHSDYVKPGQELRTEFEDYAKTIFGTAIHPFGDVELEFVFDAPSIDASLPAPAVYTGA